MQASDIFRLRLLNPEGLVFWASIPEEIGIIHSPEEHGDHLDTGAILVSIDSARAHEYEAAEDGGAVKAADAHADDEHGANEMIAEIDAPVAVTGGFGRVEMFVDLTEARTAFIARVRIVIGFVAAIAALAGGVLMIAVVQGNRRRLRDQLFRSDEEKTMLSDQLRMAREVRLLGELNEWLQSSRSLDELFDMVARFLTHILPDCEGSMYVYSNSRDVLDGCAGWNGGHHKDHIHPEECWGLRRGRTYAFGENDIDFHLRPCRTA